MQGTERRICDTVQIGGDYQFNALHNGFVVQRFWHSLKFRTIERIAPYTEATKILDLACGSGVVADYLAQRGAEVHGVDGNPSAIEFARSTFIRPNLHFHHKLADELSFPEQSFDLVVMLEFVEHIYFDQAAVLLQSLSTYLRPGGRIVLTTPIYRSLWPVIEFVLDRTGATPKMAEEQHVWRPTHAKLRALADRSGLAVTHLGRGFGFAPFMSVLGWKTASVIDELEHRLGNPFGNLLCAVFQKAK